mgnify:CR=1 FL=1
MKENSIEEDIKILDEMILNCRYKHNYYDEYAEKKAKVLEKCKKALKENEEYYKQLDLDYTENNFISKQIVKDNLIKHQEEYELLLESQGGKESNRTKYLRGRIHMCQELLEGRK